ncbi:ATP-dependent RNA helicase [Brachionus plicatilis]|uniref:ATP-dependent RNA helicase n=1 Tax=Brachionus plicatilis TaxID=10195 RepID=A0A3M7RFV0_BRAPC|nr:ATP-dependent RNA helicase [Brachionus plicatilis]
MSCLLLKKLGQRHNVNSKDAKTTIAVTSFPDSAIVYHKKIQEIFSLCSSNLVIHYEEKKAFIEFKESFELVNKIANGVYLSLVLNRLDRPIELSRVFAKDYQRVRRDLDFLRELKAKKYGIGYTSRIATTDQSMDDDVSLLVKDMNEFRIKPVVLNQLTHFWAHIDEEQHQVQLKRIEEFLAKSSYKFKLCRKEDMAVGKLVVCFHFTGNGTECGFYRARIDKIISLGCQVIFIYLKYKSKYFDLNSTLPYFNIRAVKQSIKVKF